jgi:hypothetical protein
VISTLSLFQESVNYVTIEIFNTETIVGAFQGVEPTACTVLGFLHTACTKKLKCSDSRRMKLVYRKFLKKLQRML